MKIAVMGAGAVGCYFGGMLARAGHEGTLVARPPHVEAIRRDGLLLDTVSFQERVQVRAQTEPSAVRGAELVLRAWLIQDGNGQPLTQFALRSRFARTRTLAKVDFQFRDIRAKAATDTGDLAHSQSLLGHKNREMTEHYVKARKGARVKPLR